MPRRIVAALLFGLAVAAAVPAVSGCVTCQAVPSCDTGDTEVDTCPTGATCYERAECGRKILCQEAPMS